MMNETKVVHIRDKYDKLIDRRTVYGNPFRMQNDSDEERERVIKLFKEWFLKKVDASPIYRAWILGLKGKVLGCHCKPKACHGDVIVEWLNNQKKDELYID